MWTSECTAVMTAVATGSLGRLGLSAQLTNAPGRLVGCNKRSALHHGVRMIQLRAAWHVQRFGAMRFRLLRPTNLGSHRYSCLRRLVGCNKRSALHHGVRVTQVRATWHVQRFDAMRFPCRARLRLQAQTVPQAGSMLPETPAAPYCALQILGGHRYAYLHQDPLS
jgi:hypothetical protein